MEKEYSPMGIQSAIDHLEYVVKKLRYVFQLKEVEEDPFVEIGYMEIIELKDQLKDLLEEFQSSQQMFEDGELCFNFNNQPVQANPSLGRMGKNAPAYRKDLDEEKMYQLWQNNMSLNEIARRMKCSPDTVKRRLLKIELAKKRGERF